jgi:anti-sigma regulatory factor (Ser/Thr protein kinase)
MLENISQLCLGLYDTMHWEIVTDVSEELVNVILHGLSIHRMGLSASENDCSL